MTRAEKLADAAAGRALAQHAAAYKAAGVAQPYSRVELAGILLPIFEAFAPLSEAMGGGAGEFGSAVQDLQKTMRKTMRKNAKLARRNLRLLEAIATPASAVPIWGRGPR